MLRRFSCLVVGAALFVSRAVAAPADGFNLTILQTNDTQAQVEPLSLHGLPLGYQTMAVGNRESDRGPEVRAQLGAISRQGVYHALASLVEAGLIRRIQPAGSPARFQGRTGDNHYHLICRRCDHLEDVDCAVGAVPCLTPSQDWGYHID